MNALPFATSHIPPPLITKVPLLLAEFGARKVSGMSDDLAPRLLVLHSGKVTAALQKILDIKGWPHGGLNE